MKSSSLPLISLICLISVYLTSCKSEEQKLKDKRIYDSIYNSIVRQQASDDSLKKLKSNQSNWTINYFVDEFGDKSKDKYVTNERIIRGVFSNSATENSNLSAQFIIEKSMLVYLKLFEYAGDNPVKSIIESGYKVKVKYSDSLVADIFAKNISDRLKFNQTDSKKLINIFSKPGKVQFSILEISEYSHSTYKFEFMNGDNFEVKLTELTQ